MNKYLVQGVIGCLGLLLVISEMGTFARASQPVQLALFQAKKPAPNCEVHQESDETARKFVEKARQYAFYRKPKEAAQALIQAFKSARELNTPRFNVLMLEDLIPTNVQPRLVDQIVEQSIASGQKDPADAALNEMLQFTQGLGTSYSFIKTRALAQIGNYYATLGQVSQARSVLSQAVRSASSVQGAQFKTSVLTPIAQGYVAARQPDTAEKILSQSLQEAQRIKKSPLPFRKAEALQQIAVTYAKAGNYDRAIPIAQSIANTDYSVYYKAQALAGIASEYVQDGQLEPALQIAQTINAADTKAKAMAAIAAGYAKKKQPEKASQVFSQALAVAQAADNPNISKPGLLADVALEYAKAGQLDAPLAVVQKLEDAFIKAKSLAAIGILYSQAGQQQQATQLLSQTLESVNKIKEDYKKSEVLQEIIRNSIEAGQSDYAVQVAQTIPDEFARSETLQQVAFQAVEKGQNEFALKIVQAIDKKFVDYRNRGLERIAIGYAKAGEYDKALQIAADTTYNDRVRTLAAIATEYSKAGQPKRAAEIFSQSLQAANALESPDSNALGKAAVALEYAKAGQQQKADEILSQALQVAQPIKDLSSYSYVLRAIADDYIRAERYDMAFVVAQPMKDASERTSKLQEIADKYIELRQYEKAIQVVNALKAPVYKAKVLVAIARKYIQAKQPSKASPILARAFQIAKTIPGAESKTIFLSSSEVGDDYDRGSVLEEVAIGYARARQYNQALQVSQAIKAPATRQQLRQRLACFR